MNRFFVFDIVIYPKLLLVTLETNLSLRKIIVRQVILTVNNWSWSLLKLVEGLVHGRLIQLMEHLLFLICTCLLLNLVLCLIQLNLRLLIEFVVLIILINVII